MASSTLELTCVMAGTLQVEVMPEVLAEALKLTHRFPVENLESPLLIWSGLAQPRNIRALLAFLLEENKKAVSRKVHEIMNAVFRKQPYLVASGTL